jgi:fatty acid synthase subunit alpha
MIAPQRVRFATKSSSGRSIGRATNFPTSATHALDLGPSALSGIGPLTAHNLEGRGVQVIVVGEKGKGDVELFDPKTVKYEDTCAEKFTPGLVKTRYVLFT